jgi:hypothetical protein
LGENIASGVPSATDLRAALELQKLEAELVELRLPFWKKPTYLGVFLPVGAALLTLLGVVWSGYFDTKRDQLKLAKEQLESDNVGLRAEKEKLENQTRNLRDEGKLLIKELAKAVSDMEIAASQKGQELSHLIELLHTGQPNAKAVLDAENKIQNKLNQIRDDIVKIEAKLQKTTSFD